MISKLNFEITGKVHLAALMEWNSQHDLADHLEALSDNILLFPSMCARACCSLITFIKDPLQIGSCFVWRDKTCWNIKITCSTLIPEDPNQDQALLCWKHQAEKACRSLSIESKYTGQAGSRQIKKKKRSSRSHRKWFPVSYLQDHPFSAFKNKQTPHHKPPHF